jgi:hypothetical protein
MQDNRWVADLLPVNRQFDHLGELIRLEGITPNGNG